LVATGKMPIVQEPRRRPRNAGLTLIEVLTALSLMSIVTAVAATNFTAMLPGFRTRGAALLIAGDVNQARMAAVKEGRVYEYFPLSGGYRIRRDDGVGGREIVKEVIVANAYPHVQFGHTGITNDPYAVAIASSAPTGPITFQSDGTVQDPAGMFLETANGSEEVQNAVTLSAAGRVRVWKYSGGAWH
jgi:prepilin-type N-terminal cleavage/methylation domain-containing protein